MTTSSPNSRLRLYLDRAGHAWQVLRTEGATALWGRLAGQWRRLRGQPYQGHYDRGYRQWRRRNTPGEAELGALQRSVAALASPPRFSVLVPIYRVDPDCLAEAVASVTDQVYPHWELCLVDDGSGDPVLAQRITELAADDSRIRIQLNAENAGIAAASNDALALAAGDFVALLDHDDTLSPDALAEMALAVADHPDQSVFYSDEDKLDPNGAYCSPFFKPDYAPELLESQNYVGHLLVLRRSLVNEAGGFSAGVDGAQDYDLALRVIGLAGHAVHVPKVLYHWRQIPGSTAMRFGAKDYAWEAGRRALQSHCERQGINARVQRGKVPGTYRVQRSIAARPLISLIVPFRDEPALLDACFTAALEHAHWPALEIIGVNNGSELSETHRAMDRWSASPGDVRFIDDPRPFNFSALCNAGVAAARGDFIVLLNNDVEITSPGWLEALLEQAQRPDIGAVGARLLYPDGRVQHAGIVLGIGGGAGHPHKTFPGDHIGYYGRLTVTTTVSAVSAALLMVSREHYRAVGGFDEGALAIAYNDVDFCLKLQARGCRNVVTPYCEAIHHESASRGYEQTAAQRARHDREKAVLRERWQALFAAGDPLYNPNLTLAREDYTLNFEQP